MALNVDQSFFAVLCELGGSFYCRETDLADMTLSRIVADVRSGQIEELRAVLEFNPAEGWCSDITGDILAAAFPENDDSAGQESPGEPKDWSDYSSERIDARLAGVRITPMAAA